MSIATVHDSSTESAELNGDLLYEVVDGRVVEKDVSAYTVWIASLLLESLGPYVRQQKLGTAVSEMVFVLDPRTVLRRRPDVAFVSSAKWPVGRPPPPQGDWEIVPDLGVEVISPHNAYHKVVAKVHEYFKYGTTQVWIIVPESRIVQVYRGPDDVTTLTADEPLTSELIPGWSYPIAELLPHLAAEVPADHE
jgi:Uma2 family endonuclease